MARCIQEVGVLTARGLNFRVRKTDSGGSLIGGGDSSCFLYGVGEPDIW